MPISRSVMINIAMEAEATPFIDHLQLTQLDDFFPSQMPFRAYRGLYQGHTTVTVVTNGKDSVYETEACNVGTVSAAMVTMLALQKDRPDVYLNAGTAGGFRREGAAIGDIFVTSHYVYHDRRIPIPGYDTYGVGKLPSTLNATAMAATYDWKVGVCSTGNSLDKTAECDERMLQHQAAVKDMEVAAIAWTAKLHDTKFGAIKVVTDIVDGDVPTQEEFLANLMKASEQLQHALPMVLDYVASKGLEEL
jgi:5'-methylthioadenosine nucleosidase